MTLTALGLGALPPQIGQMLMVAVDEPLVARMAGTSVAMIERVYRHFCNQPYQEAHSRPDRERAARGV